MAFQQYREKQLRIQTSASTDVNLLALPAGSSVMVHGIRVLDAAATGTLAITAGAVTVMSSADVAPAATGLKRCTTPGPFFIVAATNLAADAASLADAIDMILFCAVAMIEPGAGEV